MAYINRNEFTAIVQDYDIQSTSTTLKIESNTGEPLLELSREGGNPLHVKRLFVQQDRMKIVLRDENSHIGIGDIDIPDDQLGGIGNLSIAGGGVAAATTPSEVLREGQIHTLVQAFVYGKKVSDCSGVQVAWLVGELIVNKLGEIVGVVKKGKASLITGEYVCEYVGGFLVHSNDSYESGEPIFEYNSSGGGWALRVVPGYDLSFRFSR